MNNLIKRIDATDDWDFAGVYVSRQDNPKTRKAYAIDVRGFIDRINVPLANVTFEQMLEYKKQLMEVYSEATAARKFTVIRSMYDFGIKTGYLKWNPASPIKTPKVTRRLADRILTREQIQTVLNTPENNREKAIVKLLYVTGMRCSEVCNLKWNDVTEHDDHVTLTIEGKGDKVRYVKISLSLLETLKFQSKGADYIFTTRNNNPLTTSQVRKVFRKIGQEVGFDVTPHYMRHSHASHALDNGANAVLVRDTLGHGSLTTTSQYLHANPGESSSDYIKT